MSEPLLAHRPASQSSNEEAEQHAIAEEDALLTGQRTRKQSPAPIPSTQRTRSKWREIGLFVWAVLATAAVVVLAVVYQHSKVEGGSSHGHEGEGRITGKRNLIFMVSDGMGPTSLALTRSWRHYTEGTPYDQSLVLDDYLIGQSRTRSTSSLITDSAAGATAFSCALKSYNGAISILPDHSPCGSVMEAAKRKGYMTGLVVTTRITDATPAVFASHARVREMEDGIARQMIGESHPLGRVVDLMVGGGRCHFLPNGSDEGCRGDDVDVVKVARESGWKYVDKKAEFDELDVETPKLPLLALLAHRDIPYEIDRQHQKDVFPSLEEMTRTALHTLAAATKDSEQGFFIMIEGSRIDHAGHANDPAAQVHEVLAYDRAMSAVLEFIESHEKKTGEKTLMVSTSDHETGGLAVAKQLTSSYPQYVWYPGVLANASRSASYVAHEYHDHLRHEHLHNPASLDMRQYLANLSRDSLGIHDCDESEIDTLVFSPDIAAYTFADMISRRAQTGWSTHGHSGADVNIYSSDPKVARDLTGNHENTDVGAFLRFYLGVEQEVKDITRELREHADEMGHFGVEEWLGAVPEDGANLEGGDHMEKYEGHHKRCSLCGH